MISKTEVKMYRLGILSDTHGLIPSEVFEKFKDVDAILHAGDIGNPDVLLDLQVLALVYAVRGNTDFFGGARKLPRERIMTFGPVRIGMIHGDQYSRASLLPNLEQHFAKAGVDIIVFGHTHQFYLKQHGPRWLANPGCANPALSGKCPTGILLTIAGKDEFTFEKVVFAHKGMEVSDDCDYNALD